jgi:hypothetical protein
MSNRHGPQKDDRHMVMDSRPSAPGGALNEATLFVQASGKQQVLLEFWQREYDDQDDPMPERFTGSGNFDGVAFSVDGRTWHRLVSLTGEASSKEYRHHEVNIRQAAAAAGVALDESLRLRIKFQQFGHWRIEDVEGDGIAFDNLTIHE